MKTIFSEQDETVRKWWLRIFLFQIAFSDFCLAYKFSFEKNAALLSSLGITAFLSIFFISQLSVGYAIYYCAYKKQGTKVLTAVLVLTWLGFIFFGLQTIGTFFSLVTGKKALFSLFANDYSIEGRLFTVLGWALSLFYYLLTLRLRRVNRKRRDLLIIAP